MAAMLLPIHIAAGALAVVFGYIALIVQKGGTIHRRSGLLFVYAMLVMGFTASTIELLKTPTGPNVRAGFLVAYFVGTALTTVRPESRWTRRINIAALTIAATLALFSIVGAVKIFNPPRAIHDRTDAHAADPPAVRGDVLLVMAGPDEADEGLRRASATGSAD
jgi:uncharacterized membrane protein